MPSEERRRAEAAQGPILDWSGRVTYWVRELQVTRLGAQTFLDKLTNIFPEFRALRLEISHSDRRYVTQDLLGGEGARTLHLGFGVDDKRLQVILDNHDISFSKPENVFSHMVDMGLYWWDSTRAHYSKPPNVNYVFVGERFNHHLSGRLWATLATSEPADQAFIERFVNVTDACFSNRFEVVDFETGELRGRREIDAWHSLDLAALCQEEPALFLYSDESVDGRKVGLRPLA